MNFRETEVKGHGLRGKREKIPMESKAKKKQVRVTFAREKEPSRTHGKAVRCSFRQVDERQMK